MEKGWKIQARRALLQQVAPAYQNASPTQKPHILAHFLALTGYGRSYAAWLLNHAEEIAQTAALPRSRYGPEVQQILVLVWETLNRICAKRLVPFLPDILDALEQGGYVQLSEEHRLLLLSLSAATADRLLRVHRRARPHSLSTTNAGPLLKQQTPIRTFAAWNGAQPGFLEIDLVAHCGPHIDGSFLYTLTLTDVATCWTECLPLLHRGQEAVLEGIRQARKRFPFPILGIDTDNGGEFINELLVAYCVREHITFTRGRPHEKRDQCFVEQKNRVVVRQVVGRDSLEGEHTARQLAELYQALRLYVNYFQPSMNMQAKTYEGRTVRQTYNAAKIPLQRLLLSGVLPASQQQELKARARDLDPVRLFQQLQQLQHAVFRCAVGASPVEQSTAASSLLVFEEVRCSMGLLASQESEPDREGFLQQHGRQESRGNPALLTWRRTKNDPFAGQWEQILAWMQDDLTRSSGDLFRQLQSLYPGRYQPLQIRTLQRGMRKIRAHLLSIRQPPAPIEEIQDPLSSAVELPPEPKAVEILPCSCIPSAGRSDDHPPTNDHHANPIKSSFANEQSIKEQDGKKNRSPDRSCEISSDLRKIECASTEWHVSPDPCTGDRGLCAGTPKSWIPPENTRVAPDGPGSVAPIHVDQRSTDPSPGTD